MTSSNKERTVAVQKSLETGERFPLSYFDSRRYVQHNLAIGDGLGALLEFIDGLPSGTTKVHAVRAFEDADISFAHLEYFLAPLGHVVGFEVHRWDDDRIVEHWDNLQPLPDGVNASGRTMTDGPTESEDHEHTQRNKEIVERFTTTVLVGGDVTRLHDFFDGDELIEHDPLAGDGVEGLRNRIRSGGAPRYVRLHRVLGEGNFVLTIGEAEHGGQPSAVYDLYRLSGTTIAEHWDVIEAIPPRAQWRNDNGKF